MRQEEEEEEVSLHADGVWHMNDGVLGAQDPSPWSVWSNQSPSMMDKGGEDNHKPNPSLVGRRGCQCRGQAVVVDAEGSPVTNDWKGGPQRDSIIEEQEIEEEKKIEQQGGDSIAGGGCDVA